MSDRVGELLDQALQSLEPRDRDELLRGLLLAGVGAAGSLPAGLGRPSAATPPAPVDRERLAWLLGGESPLPSDARMKVLPVRLPETDHERLRQFCQTRGFSMAVVVRTLVERFLDEHATSAQSERP